jgi:hypothetical protein
VLDGRNYPLLVETTGLSTSCGKLIKPPRFAPSKFKFSLFISSLTIPRVQESFNSKLKSSATLAIISSPPNPPKTSPHNGSFKYCVGSI